MKKTPNAQGQTSPPGKPPKKEANQYDKMLKEGFREELPNLMTRFLGFPEGEYSDVHVELQATIEKKADFLGKLSPPPGAAGEEKIVHLEIQATDEHTMIYREHLYSGLIMNAYPGLDVEQTVFYIGLKKPTMPTRLIRTMLDYGFRLVWVKDFHYRDFIETGRPTLMQLAILAHHGDRSEFEVLTEVVEKVRKIMPSGRKFRHFVAQLHVLSNLHNLQQIFEKVMLNVSELIDEKKDPFFQRGIKIGEEKGIEKEKISMTVRLILNSDHEDDFIGTIVGIKPKVVGKIRKIMSEHPEDYLKKLEGFDLQLESKPNGKHKKED